MFVLSNFLVATAVVVNAVLNIYWWIIIASAVLSWVNPDPYNPIVRFLMWNLPYHAEHHLFMYLPCYRLPEAHRILVEKGFIRRMEVRPGYLDVMRLATSRRMA